LRSGVHSLNSPVHLGGIELIGYKSISSKKYLDPTMYILSAFLVLLARWPAHDSEDIKNLRSNFESASPNDFWGGFSAFFYGKFPDFYPGWESLLLIFQWLCATSGLLVVLLKIKRLSFYVAMILLIVLVSMSTLITRDALMLSLMLFGLGLATIYKESNSALKPIIGFFSIFVFFIASCFRPWVGVAIAFLVLMVFPNLRFGKVHLSKFIFILSFASLFFIASVGVEIVSTKALALDKSYPEQQVMMMDLAASACWSTNRSAVSKSKEGLANFYIDGSVPSYFCNTFRPTNWVHLFHQDMLSGNQPGFRLIPEGDTDSYKKLRTAWFNSALSHPVDYFQTKLMYASQTLLGGESRKIRLLDSNYFENSNRSESYLLYSGLVLALLDFAVSLHIFSPFFSLLFLGYVYSLSLRKKYFGYFPKSIIWLSAFLITWFICTVIAYIGDTARFTYTSGAIVILTLLCQRESRENSNS
jgi:hypothetical protein